MALKLKKGIKELVAEAYAEIETVKVPEALKLKDDPNVLLVDLRDIRELQRDGRIPGALHAPRGMLEFWVDPESPYYKEIFGSGKKFVFFCAGGLRSALAAQTVQNMGLEPVCHIEGGFRAWKEARRPGRDGKAEGIKPRHEFRPAALQPTRWTRFRVVCAGYRGSAARRSRANRRWCDTKRGTSSAHRIAAIGDSAGRSRAAG